METETWRLSNDITLDELKMQDYIALPTINYMTNISSYNYTNLSTSYDLRNASDVTYNYSCDIMRDYVNITCELPINYAVPMYGYIMPFLLFITIIANTLIVVVLSKRHMRTPTNVVLMAMALCDMFTLLFPAPWLIYMYTFGNHYKPLWPISICYAWSIMHEVIQFALLR